MVSVYERHSHNRNCHSTNQHSISSNNSSITHLTTVSSSLLRHQKFKMATSKLSAAPIFKNGGINTSQVAVNPNAITLTLDDNIPGDVRKVGFMRKLKTNRRKFFVLRLNSLADPSLATLSYYDSEKKFRTNPESTSSLCKGRILLRDCFAITRKNDHKQRCVIAIYTRTEMLGCICDDSIDMQEWLDAMQDVLEYCPQYMHRQLRDFEHIWQVTIQRSGLAQTKALSGVYRFCLLDNVLYIIKVETSASAAAAAAIASANADSTSANSGSSTTQEVYECPLQGIRRCGHSLATFFLELGRSSLIGPGELWLTTDDPSSAQNMHEVILNAMSAGSQQSDDDFQQRFRTSSVSSSRSHHRPRSSSASIHNSDHHTFTRPRKSNASDIGRSGGGGGASIQKRPNSSRSSCEKLSTSCHGTGGGGAPSERSRTTSECSVEDFSPFCDCNTNAHFTKVCCISSAYNSNNSIDGSTGSSNDYMNDGVHMTGEVLTLEPPISEEADGCNSDDYFPTTMSTSPISRKNSGSGKNKKPPSPSTGGGCSSSGRSKSDSNHSISSMCSSKSALQSPVASQSICVHLSHLRPSRSNSISCAQDRCHVNVHQQCCTGAHSQYQSSPISSPKCSCSSCQFHGGVFQTLPTVPAGTDDDYLPMAPINSVYKPSAVMVASARSQYAEVYRKLAAGVINDEDDENGSYLEMSPLAQAPNCSTITTHKNEGFFDGLTRAYSTGSKPKPLAPSIATQCTVQPPPLPQQPILGDALNGGVGGGCVQTHHAEPSSGTSAASRIRAFSTGSHSLSFNNFRLRVHRAKQKSIDSGAHMQSSVSVETPTDATTSAFSSSSSTSLVDSEVDSGVGGTRKNSKASSAPILSACINQRVRSATIGARPAHHGSHRPLSTSQRLFHNARTRHHHCCNEPESDLMEITYATKPRRDSCGEIIGSFEEESRRLNRSRKSSTSTDAAPNGGAGPHQSKAEPSNNSSSNNIPRKRSGSTSAISFTFKSKHQPTTPKNCGAQSSSTTGNNAASNTQGHHGTATSGSSTKLDTLFHNLRTMSLHQRSSGHSTGSGNGGRHSRGDGDSPSHSKPTKMNPILKKISRDASREILARQKSSEEKEKRQAAAISAISTAVSTAAKTDLEMLTRKLEEKARQMDEENRKYCSDDEESPYVLVLPIAESQGTTNASSNSKNSSNNRKKTSVVRSFISSLSGKDNNNAANHLDGGSSAINAGSSATHTSTETPRKKSSTFSGKLRIGRPGSGKKTSVSECDVQSRSPTSSPPL